MPNVRRFLSRRWLLAFLGVLALLFGLAMLHPYPRQSLLGPTIRGKPWCVWEDAIRRYVNSKEYRKKLSTKTLNWLGIQMEAMDFDELFDHDEMFPLLLELTEDPDVQVRLCALQVLIRFDRFYNRSAIPVLRRRLEDSSASCRIRAAVAIGLIDRTEPVLDVLIREIDRQPNADREWAIMYLSIWAQRDRELFPHLARYATHDDAEVRTSIMLEMQKHGDKALPVLFKGVDDSSADVRRMAICSLYYLNPDAKKEGVPRLLRCLDDEHAGVRFEAARTIALFDPETYQRLKTEGKIK